MKTMWFMGINDEGDRVAISEAVVDRVWQCGLNGIEGTFVSHSVFGVPHRTLIDTKSLRYGDGGETIRFLSDGKEIK